MLDTKYGMKYPFPHTLVHIVDNSAYTGDLPVAVADDPSMYGQIVVAGFPMGEDRKVIPISRSDILSVAYGLGNIGASEIKKYGQAITYPLSAIDQGAPVQLLRVTPPDATYAYSCITIEWKWEKTDQVMHVRYGTERLPNDRDLVNYQNKDRLAAAIKKAVKSDNADGWKRRAFMVCIGAGRGSAYNFFTTAINQTVQPKRPANVQYLFETIDTKKNLVVEQFLASLVNINNQRQDAVDPINIVVGKRAEGSSIVVPYFNEEAIVELYDEYRLHLDEALPMTIKWTPEYVNEVKKALTINTFDPIFGLYLYEGTDVNNRLPYFQVDMRSADLQLLPESQRVYYTEGENRDKVVSDKLLTLTTGVTNAADAVHIGDIYLYGGTTSYVSPYVYVVVGINQNTGALTTVRTNMLHFKKTDAYIDNDSRLATIIETADKTSFLNVLNERIQKGYVEDGESVAWYNTVTEVWDIYYVTTGSKALVTGGTYIAEVTSNPDLLPSYAENSVENPGYSFIAWNTITSIGNLIGIMESTYPNINGTAATRAGATCIDVTAPFDTSADPQDSNGSVWVNSGYYDDREQMIPYYVANRTAAAVKKYGAPPQNVADALSKDVVNTQFDAFLCDAAHAQAYTIKDDATISFDAGATINRGTGENSMILGWKPEGASGQLFRFQATAPVSGTTYSLKEVTDSEVSSTYYDGMGGDVTAFVAWRIFNGFLSEYQLVETEPVDWATSYTTYYIKGETGYVHVTGEEAPAWDPTKYYTQTEDAEFYTSAKLTLATKIDRTDNVNKWSAFKDMSSTTPTYYRIDGTSGEYAALSGYTSDNQFLRWYVESSSGDWIEDNRSNIDGFTNLGGYTVTIPRNIFTYVEDARAASQINRYTVIGTLGSLYRIQENAVSPNPDYYSSAYGINITTADGGVALEDGYTGFFDDSTSDIEFKWNYSILLVNAFRGKIDPRIMSPTKTPAKYLFDGAWNTVVGQSALPTMSYTAGDLIAASTIFTDEEKDEILFNPDIVAGWSAKNSDIDVKQAMYDLTEYRIYQGIPEDKRPVGPGSGLSLHLDAGYTDASQAAIINNSFMKRFNNPNVSWDIGGWVSSVDGLAYTYVKRIADNLFRHCKTYSVNKPFVNTYSKIDRSEYISCFPDIDTTDWEFREVMYNSGGNAWIPDVNGAIMRRSQRTLMRGSDTSDLVQESNMRTLTQLVYLLQNKLDEKLFEYNDDSILRTMQDEVNNMFSNWVGNLVDGLDIHFERDINPIDGGELVVCYVDVVFRGINLRIPIIVNVNRRLATT